MKKIKKNKYLGSSFSESLKKRLEEDPEFAILYEKEMFLSSIAKNIINLREGAGLTQKELAEKVKTTQSAISRIESPKNSRIPSLGLLNRIAIALGMELVISFKKKSNK